MKVRTMSGIAFWTAILMLAVLLGSQHGTRVEARSRIAMVAEDDYEESLRTFTELYALVEANHATEVDPEVAVYGAIDGMLRTLDPHSRFFTPDAFDQLRQDQSGTYYGLGITVSSRFGKVTVVSPPFPGAPAEKVGLRVGDVISHVNGEPTEGANLNAVVSRLKGPRGTPVNITIVRPGLEAPFDLEVVRDEISKFTISNKFEIRDGVGYIKLDSFAETTGEELRQALDELDIENLSGGLILDLRGNPGGLLQQAIEVSETFLLERGQLIVETRGRVGGSDRDYRSSRSNGDGAYPLVVLIDRSSASASEIVAGAIQDHDRGLIVGETSFGKGLVQSVYPLSKSAGLALTTQKWYTPSGRLIQRDYSEISEFDYYNTRDEHPPTEDEIKYSDLGRVVYGGGGITPDHIVPQTELSSFRQRFPRMGPPFHSFVQEYLEQHSIASADFQISDEVLAEFAAHVRDAGAELSDEELAENADYLAGEIRYEIVYDRFGVTEAQKAALEGDAQVLEALRRLGEARDLVRRAVAASDEG